MDRPTETIKLPNGVEVVLHTYLTVREKSDIMRSMDIVSSTKEMTVSQGLDLRDKVFNTLLVSPKQFDALADMPAEYGDVLYTYAMEIFNGKNV